MFAVPSATLVILAFVSVLFVARFKFPELSTVKFKSLVVLLAPLFSIRPLNLGTSFIPIVSVASLVVASFPINVAILSPTYLGPLLSELKLPPVIFILSVVLTFKSFVAAVPLF